MALLSCAVLLGFSASEKRLTPNRKIAGSFVVQVIDLCGVIGMLDLRKKANTAQDDRKYFFFPGSSCAVLA